MRRLLALTVAWLFSASLIPAAMAATKAKAVQPKIPQGLVNCKKMVQAKQERGKKVRETFVKGQAKRNLAQSGK